MAKRIADIILLVEDLRTELLLRRYLQRLGQDSGKVRALRIPDGKGSGEQFVRVRYATEVRALRAAHAKTCLIAAIDADTGTTAQRRQQLERALRDAREPARDARERILNLIPKRNVETWILCLDSIAVDEVKDYRRSSGSQAGCSSPLRWTRPNAAPPGICVESLRECLSEFGRIPA
jgi:hypothetical protein